MKKFNPEILVFIVIYICLIMQAIIKHDSIAALISAFCGITYTILAGKGVPICYPIGAAGSAFYVYLSYLSSLWGNLLLYAFYYIPMQIFGFFLWNKNLKTEKYEIVKTVLTNRERIIYAAITTAISFIVIVILKYSGDTSPVFDGITTVFSLLGMFLTVKRCLEQWIVWLIVNGLSFIMWLKIAVCGGKVYSTVFMWGVYFILAIYFYINWRKDLLHKE